MNTAAYGDWRDTVRQVFVLLAIVGFVSVARASSTAWSLNGLRVSRIVGEGHGVPFGYLTAKAIALEMARRGAWSRDQVNLTTDDMWRLVKSPNALVTERTGATIRGNEESPQLFFRALCGEDRCHVWLSVDEFSSARMVTAGELQIPREQESGSRTIKAPPASKELLLDTAIARAVLDMAEQWEKEKERRSKGE